MRRVGTIGTGDFAREPHCLSFEMVIISDESMALTTFSWKD
jgi:hypothetical protein